MNNSIEPGMEWIENPYDLNIDYDKLSFSKVLSVTSETQKNIDVWDLEIDNQKNYIVKDLGIVHNGGGLVNALASTLKN
jgi:hypothetical protein